ncbi:hypothetical protein [Nocardia sp. NPDC006630]|uniref:hypothetical protein n=1 Tax=Nocardia sp. NPDC006630 TaxID=3157181 RepID=UPI0033B3A535
MNLLVVQTCPSKVRKIGAFALTIAAVGALAGCGGSDSGGGITKSPDQSQMESNLRAVMAAKNPNDVSDKFCSQFGDLIKSMPAEMLSNASTVRPKGQFTKLEKVQITGEKATAEASGKLDNGSDYSGPVTFKKESGEWKYCPDLGITMPTPQAK